MRRKSPRILLVSLSGLLPVALCAAQQGAMAGPQQPPSGGRAAQLTIPEVVRTATQYRVEGRVNEAIALLRDVLQRDETNIDALRMMGDIAWDARNAQEAQKYWRSVRQIQESDYGANYGLGQLHLGSNSYRSAVSYLETAAKVVPADPPELASRTLVALTQAYRGAGDLDQAIRTSQRAVEVVETQLKTVSPTPALETARFEAWYALAAVQTEIAGRVRRQQDYDRALGFAERLIQIAGEQLEAVGTSLQGVERVQSAYALQLQVLYAYRDILFERNPSGRLSDRVIPGMQGLAAAISGKTVDVMLRQADLDRTRAHFQIRQIAEMSVNYDGGTNPKSLLNLGTLQVATGQTEQAVTTFRRVLEIDPTNELAQQQLDAVQMQRTVPPSSQPVEAATP